MLCPNCNTKMTAIGEGWQCPNCNEVVRKGRRPDEVARSTGDGTVGFECLGTDEEG